MPRETLGVFPEASTLSQGEWGLTVEVTVSQDFTVSQNI